MPASTDSDYVAHLPDLRALRRFVRVSSEAEQTAQAREEEQCQMCSLPLTSTHRHLLDLAGRGIVCVCDACALLFASEGAGQGKYRLLPRRVLALSDFQMTDRQWEELMLPVNLLYLFHSTPAGRALAFYPSPAGPMESLLSLDNWETLVRTNPILSSLEPDVEALLVQRIEHNRVYYLVPIDTCYRLVGLLRRTWKGLHGGPEVWENIAAFFADLQRQATTASIHDICIEQTRPVTDELEGDDDANA